MADVKVPPLLHKMSATAQKAWYKKHGMEMPSATSSGKSAAQAKKDVGEINKKKAREAAIATAAAASKKNKELVSSSDRVRLMRKNADAFGGGLGGGLDRNRDIVNFVRSGGYIKAGRLGEETVDEAFAKTKDVNKQKLKNYVRGLGTKAAIAGKVPFDQVNSPLRAGRKVLKQEEVEQVDEANMRFDPEAAARPKSSDVKNFLNRDKNPRAAAASKKYIRRMTKLGGLGPNQTKKDTEAHMKAHFEEVEQVSEDQASDMQKIQSMDKGSMVGGKTELKTHLKYLNAMHTHQKKYGLDAAKTKKKIGDVSRSLVQMGEEVEQVDEEKKPDASMAMTNTLKMKMLSDKDKKTLGKVADLMASQKKKTVKEGVDMKYIEEKLSASDPASKWIADFVKSDNPKFAGKSKKERINQALGAYYAAKRGKVEEGVAESMDAVGREDKDVDNDGDSDKTDLYLSKRRKAIGNAIRKKVAGKMEK